MVDFADVSGVRGAKLSDLSQHVADVLAVRLQPGDEYVVGSLALESYEFVPYALNGLSAAMADPAPGAIRSSTTVTVPIADDKGGTSSASKPVTLYGPGDVLGLDPGQIVRRYPSPGSVNAEETFHAHVEFDRPELPWTFSASSRSEKLAPWVILVVLEEGEVAWEPARAGLQPILVTDAANLPPLAETATAAGSYAWAHAQAPKGAASLPARLSTAFAPVNVSRLLATRILTQDTNYVACVVPSTDAGLKAGLGLPAGTLAPGWTQDDGQVRLPVYDHWEFRTAPDGDFARLARRLLPIAAPWEIGRRILDTSRPGEPLAELAAGSSGRRQVIRCALFSPNPAPAGAPADDSAWSAANTTALREAVERAAVIEGNAGTDPGAIPDLPIVGPRVYAEGQRGAATMPTDDWFSQINTEPVNRVVSGLGTRVVRKDQEPLMQAAWSQVGEIDKANRALALAQLARHAAVSLHARLAKIDPGRLLQVTRPLAKRVRIDGSQLTLAAKTEVSATPAAALGGGFRKVTRAAGPVTRRLGADEQQAITRLAADRDGARDFTRTYVELDGIGGLSEQAVAGLDANAVALALGVPAAEALATVTRASGVLANNPTLATATSTPSVWRDADVQFQAGAALAQRIGADIQATVPKVPGRDLVTSRWLGGLAAGLASTEIAGTQDMSDLAVKMDTAVMKVAQRVGATEPAPVVVHGHAVRAGGAEMLRTSAAWRVNVPIGGATPVGLANLSEAALGRTELSILRPTAVVVEAGQQIPALDAGARVHRILTPQGKQIAAYVERAAAVSVSDLRAQLVSLVAGAGALDLALTPAREKLAVTRAALVDRLDPARTVVAATAARLRISDRVPADWFADTLIRPIMAAPRFDRPMYQALDDYDREWLVPGLTKLKADELVTVLTTNGEFSEAFLTGLSDEMGRELLWREYPTDRRGTYFFRFWDPSTDELLAYIHRFTPTPLGSHVSSGTGEDGRAVVLIRGELVRRYPDLTIMALKEQGRVDGMPILPEIPVENVNAVKSLFHAPLPPDVLLAGLDIRLRDLRQEGWWIVLSEHPQATRFRRKEGDLVGHEVRFTGVAPHETGASVAADRLEDPTRIAFKAIDFLPSS